MAGIELFLQWNIFFTKYKNSVTFAAALQKFRDVAQPGSAHVWGAWGRKFESCHPDQKSLRL